MRINHVQIHIQGEEGKEVARPFSGKTITWTRTEDNIKGYGVTLDDQSPGPAPIWASDLKLMTAIQAIIDTYNGGK